MVALPKRHPARSETEMRGLLLKLIASSEEGDAGSESGMTEFSLTNLTKASPRTKRSGDAG